MREDLREQIAERLWSVNSSWPWNDASSYDRDRHYVMADVAMSVVDDFMGDIMARVLVGS